MKPQTQTVYLPADAKDCDFIVRDYDDSYENDVKREEGYFFTPEQLNEYTQHVIKQTLETAYENAECECKFVVHNTPVWGINQESITNTCEETFKKFEV